MMQHHNYSLYDLENLIPWEKDIYLSQLIEYIEIENEKMKMLLLEQHRQNA